MKLTPLDIRRQEFKRVVRGIDPEEVSVFLDMVAGEFERILRESKALSEERDELKRKVDELDSMKEAIQGAVARPLEDERPANVFLQVLAHFPPPGVTCDDLSAAKRETALDSIFSSET